MTPAIRTILLGQRPWSFRDWFRSGEQGAVYEADNPADGGPVTAYQESTGITPVTAPGQGAADCVIGFLVDKKRGDPVPGADQVTNGGFADATGWTLGDASVTISGGALRFASTPNAITATGAVSASVVGTTYLITVTFSSFTAGTVRIARGGVTADFAATATGARTARITATAANTSIILQAIGTTTAVVDSISVQVLPGNHATQATTASKPVLTARYNLLTQTEAFDNAVWLPVNSTVSPNAVASPAGTTTADKLIASAGGASRHSINNNTAVTVASGVSYKLRFSVAAAGVGFAVIRVNDNATNANACSFVINLATGAISGAATNYGTFTGAAAVVTQSGSFYDCTLTFTPSVTAIICKCELSADGTRTADGQSNTFVGDGAAGIYIWGADLRTSADAALSIPAYQRVTDASNYDTAGFPCRIKFDGFDDSLQTAAVDFTGTDKMTVVAGLMNTGTSAIGCVLEMSATSTGTAGTLGVLTNATTGGTVSADSYRTSVYQSSLHTLAKVAAGAAVLSTSADFAGSGATEMLTRINGDSSGFTESGPNAGAGAFGNHAMNIGRRNGASLPLNAYLTRLIICGATRSDSQIIKAERSTALKMALQY
jgi:hypothetical protein